MTMRPSWLGIALLMALGFSARAAPKHPATGGHPQSVKPIVPGPAMMPIKSRVHIDRQAGVKFLVPRTLTRSVSGGQIESILGHSPPLPEANGEKTRFTSGVLGTGDAPMVVVWTTPEPMTKDLADRVARGETEFVQGLTHFQFLKDRLRGEGGLGFSRGLRAEVLIQLVKGRATYVGLYYRTPEQLKELELVKRSVRVGRLSQIKYETLPAGDGKNGLATLLGGFALLGAVVAGAILLYRWMGRRQSLGIEVTDQLKAREPAVDLTPQAPMPGRPPIGQ